MIKRKYIYTDIDGNHWPDAEMGDDLYYAIDFSCWLTNEADTIIAVRWTIPAGAHSSDEFLVGTEATVKISVDKPGSYKIIGTIDSTDSNNVIQTNSVPMILKVF